MLLPSCQKENTDPPTISYIRNYAASPNDTILHTLSTGQWVALVGKNLGGVTHVQFGSIDAQVNNTFFSDTSVVIQIPSIPFQSLPASSVNVITVANEHGSVNYNIDIFGPPIVTYVRNAASAPNDTLLKSVAPGQLINIIGFNLKSATKITFQGVEADLAAVTYTDSSAIVKVPKDFSGADASQANKIKYTTNLGDVTLFMPIIDPALLAIYKNELWTLLTGGIGNKKTWVLDLDPATGNSKKFIGPIWWAGLDLGWDKQCGSGGSCWTYEVSYQGWFPAVKDYGTMTFQLKGNVVVEPVLTVTQKNGDPAQNGTFTGSFFLDVDAKTITFIDVVPLNFGWQYIFTKAYIISLTADGMQLGFKDKVKSEYAVHNYIPKK